MSAPSSRTAPATVVGQVTVLAPTGVSPYYRLSWINPDGSAGRTTAGKNLAAAVAKATPLAGILADYLSTGVGRHGKIRGGDWSGSQLKQTREKLTRCTQQHLDVPAMAVTRTVLDTMRAALGTPQTHKENTVDSSERRNSEPSGCHGEDGCWGLPVKCLRGRLFLVSISSSAAAVWMCRSVPLGRY